MGVKAVIVVMVIIPQLAITSVLLWLGSRWLTATEDFTDLLLNAVALEFIFQLKDLLYRTVVSTRSMQDMEHTEIAGHREPVEANVVNVFDSLLWVPVAVGWCFAYVFVLQQVLPHYNWD